MIFVKLLAKASEVHGTGAFSREALRRGTVLSFWGDEREVRFLNTSQHAKKLKKKSRITKETAVRLMGELFVESKRIEDKDPTDYINHSARPNVGYMGGLLFALCDIRRGAELFLDYRLLNASYETNVVRGLSASAQLRSSARQVKRAFSPPR